MDPWCRLESSTNTPDSTYGHQGTLFFYKRVFVLLDRYVGVICAWVNNRKLGALGAHAKNNQDA